MYNPLTRASFFIGYIDEFLFVCYSYFMDPINSSSFPNTPTASYPSLNKQRNNIFIGVAALVVVLSVAIYFFYNTGTTEDVQVIPSATPGPSINREYMMMDSQSQSPVPVQQTTDVEVSPTEPTVTVPSEISPTDIPTVAF